MDKTLIDEMIAAARGTIALLAGKRSAAKYYDLSLKGLMGSLIAFVVAVTFNAFAPHFSGSSAAPQPWQALIMVALLYVFQTGFGALVLNQFGRLDGLVPYLVADNWATFFITAISGIMVFAGLNADGAILVVGLLVIILEINIARLIVTLKPIQIAIFIIAQLVGAFVGLMVLGAIFPSELVGSMSGMSGAHAS
ncbi:hypothetical protein MNBD_ALPHA12-305 [hydrothermal vent metagenome]|uniref:Yip1 domain-containing protein n=1 Tax=hydrothermal vent metagenome TaxID=652676 RepID=A0A3B0UB43_9ZZZZ